jgi:hypothetical protein
LVWQNPLLELREKVSGVYPLGLMSEGLDTVKVLEMKGDKMGFVANGVDVSSAKYFYVGKKQVVELACPDCGKVFQAKEAFSLADLINKCHNQREEKLVNEKPCVCERIDSVSVGYVPSPECFGCGDED